MPSKPTGLESLVGLKWHDGTNARPVLLRVLTELYVEKPTHSADEEQQFVELMLRRALTTSLYPRYWFGS